MNAVQQQYARVGKLLRHRFGAWLALCASLAVLPASALAEDITVTHWGASFYGAPYAVAMEKGWFKTDKFDVTGIITSTGGGTSVRNTLASSIPIGEVALPAAIEAVRAGAKVNRLIRFKI